MKHPQGFAKSLWISYGFVKQYNQKLCISSITKENLSLTPMENVSARLMFDSTTCVVQETGNSIANQQGQTLVIN